LLARLRCPPLVTNGISPTCVARSRDGQAVSARFILRRMRAKRTALTSQTRQRPTEACQHPVAPTSQEQGRAPQHPAPPAPWRPELPGGPPSLSRRRRAPLRRRTGRRAGRRTGPRCR
jgi:hypothetical protein